MKAHSIAALQYYDRTVGFHSQFAADIELIVYQENESFPPQQIVHESGRPEYHQRDRQVHLNHPQAVRRENQLLREKLRTFCRNDQGPSSRSRRSTRIVRRNRSLSQCTSE